MPSAFLTEYGSRSPVGESILVEAYWAAEPSPAGSPVPARYEPESAGGALGASAPTIELTQSYASVRFG
jgi:hypothetical protein